MDLLILMDIVCNLQSICKLQTTFTYSSEFDNLWM